MAQINALITEKITMFLSRVGEQGIHIDSAYLFGSFVKGNDGKWSDIDIAVISSDISEDRLKERVRLMMIACDIDNRIEPVPFRPEDFTDEDPLVWEIKRYGVKLV
ncbi:MAG: nucleotidyltransferase domain-containing protein [Nitrospirae bacterium]|uniref:nucleotidyltransferase domain-containing protein n=1 Tax=Candidatus Magnetobacterium casense TaxID=1455061 RepID=UPI00058C0FDB|nr:nucleotidyltransferase domain-containing protein [Candidatus Magnetobacterium casensis]MBF0337781.1 nucleotidyltransferase domain-containing protein [Nitrospirota bacterium]